jgi:hypothetical protein
MSDPPPDTRPAWCLVRNIAVRSRLVWKGPKDSLRDRTLVRTHTDL